jgi:hypothetical protein
MQIQHVRSISVRRIAQSTGLAALISIVAIGTALLGVRYNSAPQAHIPAERLAQSAPLGVSRPSGVDVRTLPAGYSDYFLPEDSSATAQPVVGRSMVVTAPVFDGTRYKSAPIVIGASGNSFGLDLWSAVHILAAELSKGLGLDGSAAPLGIPRPAGVDVRELPSGLTDYFLPQESEHIQMTQPVYLGIDLPAGAQPSDLPAGLTDYLRPGR